MDFLKLLHILTFLSLAAAASHVDLDIYWKSKLPNTPMPKAVSDLLRNELLQDSKGVGKGVSANKLPVYNPNSNFLFYNHIKGHDYSGPSVFFLEEDLRSDASMNLQFPKSINTAAAFLPRQVADSIPFSSQNVSEILKKFSVKPQSVYAEIIKKTIKECEYPTVEGEERYCATSLESMVDFSISKLGKNVKAVSTEVQEDQKPQKYGVVDVNRLNHNDKAVSCHKQNYVYAVFYCHTSPSTEAYIVTMVGDYGARVKAVAVCHKDTSKWSPKYFAFRSLNVKPGTVPICHFLPEDHIIWVNTK